MIKEVLGDRLFYAPFLPRGSLDKWAKGMATDGIWVDSLAVAATANVITRPIVIWRVGPSQVPSCILPLSCPHNMDAEFVYVLLDESKVKCDHHTALFRQDAPMEAQQLNGRMLLDALGPLLAAAPKPAEGRAAKKPKVAHDVGASAGNASGAGASKKWKAGVVKPCGQTAMAPTPRPLKKPASQKGKLSDLEIRKAVYVDTDAAMPTQEIANAHGLSQRHMRRMKNVLGADRYKTENHTMTDKDAVEFAKRKAAGDSLQDIAACMPSSLGHGKRASVQSKVDPVIVAESILRDEQGKLFVVAGPQPPAVESLACKTPKNKDLTDMMDQQWISVASWTMCPSCGRRRPDGELSADWAKHRGSTIVYRKCGGGCDLAPAVLNTSLGVNSDDMGEKQVKPKDDGTSKVYVTPAIEHWTVLGADGEYISSGLLDLTLDEASLLAPLDLKCDYSIIRGGKASTSDKKKTAVIRAPWRNSNVEMEVQDNAKVFACYQWLMGHNSTYRHYIRVHDKVLAGIESGTSHQWILTAELSLKMPGVEVAARPWLYPTPAFGDTDLKVRLVEFGHTTESQKPSLKRSWVRKMCSRCVSYMNDFALFSLLHDIALARQTSSIVSTAKEKNIAPDEAANNMHNFGAYWVREQHKLEDMCRQNGLPNLSSRFRRPSGIFLGTKVYSKDTSKAISFVIARLCSPCTCTT